MAGDVGRCTPSRVLGQELRTQGSYEEEEHGGEIVSVQVPLHAANARLISPRAVIMCQMHEIKTGNPMPIWITTQISGQTPHTVKFVSEKEAKFFERIGWKVNKEQIAEPSEVAGKIKQLTLAPRKNKHKTQITVT